MKKGATILLVAICFFTKAQDIHFSQFSKSQTLLNPSLLSFQENDYQATLQRRSQWASITKPYNTVMLSIDRKDLIRTYSLGAQILNDITGDSRFRTFGLTVSCSKRMQINNEHNLSFGGGVGFFQRSMSFQDLIFNEIEPTQNLNFWFPEVNLGIASEHRIKEKTTITTGIALFHLNRAKQSLIDNDNVKLHQKINLHISAKYFMNKTLAISPAVFFSNQEKEKEFIFAFDTEYLIKESEVALKSGFSHRWADAIIYNFGLKIYNFECIFSYDINTSSLVQASQNKGGGEVVIIYFWNIKQKQKMIKTKECPKYF